MSGASNLDIVNVIATVSTLLVLTATSVAAMIQLRHMRVSNQLGALMSLEHEFHTEDLQKSFRFVQFEFSQRMHDRAYRAELERIGFIDSRVHPEMDVLNWFNEMGTLLKNGLVDETTFMELFGRLAVQYWEILSSAIAIVRRRRGDAQFHNFEYLAIRARKWLSDHPHGEFPKGAPRIPILDEWREEDGKEPQDIDSGTGAVELNAGIKGAVEL